MSLKSVEQKIRLQIQGGGIRLAIHPVLGTEALLDIVESLDRRFPKHEAQVVPLQNLTKTSLQGAWKLIDRQFIPRSALTNGGEWIGIEQFIRDNNLDITLREKGAMWFDRSSLMQYNTETEPLSKVLKPWIKLTILDENGHRMIGNYRTPAGGVHFFLNGLPSPYNMHFILNLEKLIVDEVDGRDKLPKDFKGLVAPPITVGARIYDFMMWNEYGIRIPWLDPELEDMLKRYPPNTS